MNSNFFGADWIGMVATFASLWLLGAKFALDLSLAPWRLRHGRYLVGLREASPVSSPTSSVTKIAVSWQKGKWN